VKYGIVILPEYRWSQAQELWQRAEQYGFDHAWTYDHVGWRDLVDGPWFDAVPTLAAAALVTKTIKLGTHVASANYRHPAVFAREITALDDLAEGRFLLGIGAGGKGYDESVLGTEPLGPRDKVNRYEEFVTLLHAILNNHTTTSSGAYFSVSDARSTPGAFNESGIPFIIAANAPRSIDLAAKYGDGWMTTGAPSDTLDEWWAAVGANVARFEEAVTAAGRDHTAIPRYLSLDAAPVYSLQSSETFADFVGRAEALRFTDVVAHWPRKSSWYTGDEAVLDEIATNLLARANA
jgi:alkanesulfonate monooxygenase SsuD/methylene tetrahydromethanopterin reductase-like flavin-dependent oxidoreductase (luciferase family)